MSIKKIIVLVLAGVLLAAVVFGATFYFLNYRQRAEREVIKYQHFLGEFTANVSTNRNFFRSSMVIETTDKGLVELIENRDAIIRDRIINIVIGKKTEDLLSPEGQQQLREEILKALSEILESDAVTNLFFTNYIVQ